VEHGDLTGALLDGRYRVIEPVAEGAMGVVYRAERVKLGRIVAIKVLHDVLPNELSARKRFEIEAMAMAKLEHPHCASVLDVGVHGERPYVVMDFVGGQNLKEVVATGPQPIWRATEIVRQVLSGLAHAHEHGIIHRDIKPANIVLSQKTGLGDHVKILDFGLARLHDTGQNLTSGIVVGTPAYMAPEQIRGVQLDHRVDLYACGVLLFELLTGRKPFHSETDDPIEVCKMHLSDPIPRLDDKLPGVEFGELEAIVAKALAKHRDDRYASAEEYAAAIAAVDAAAPRRTSVAGLPPAPPSGPIRLASADVIAVGDVSYPPEVEVRSADVMSAIPDDEPAALGAALEVDAHGRTAPPAVTPAAGIARGGTATPAAGIARGGAATPAAGVARAGSEPVTELADPPSRPGTFLGLPVTGPREAPPPTSGPREVQSQASASRAASAGEPGEAQPPATGGAWPVRRALRRRAIAIVAGALAIAAVALAIAAGRGGTASSGDAGVASGAAGQPDPDPAHDIVARANQLVAQGDREAALELVTRARRQYPASAALPYTAGRIYFAKYYWTDGLKSFRDALRLEPAYRTDPELIKTVLRGFIMTPSYNDELASFLRDDIGSAAQPLLEETARDHPNAAIRSRASNELHRYR